MNQCDREPEGAVHDDPPGGEAAPAPGNELIAHLKQIGAEFAELFREGARLIGAESRLFATTLLLIATLLIVLGFVVAGALVLLGVAFVLLLIRYGGLDPVIAVLIVMLALVGLAAGIVGWVRGLTRHLRFSESRRMLARISANGQDTHKEDVR